VIYDTSDAVFPLNVEYRAYFLKKGGNGKFPTDSDGFLDPNHPQLPKLAITEIYRQQEVIE
jgi:hypothetical protein